MELQIDTSTRYASVGLSIDGRSIVQLSWRSERNHSVELVPGINRALDHAGVTVQDLTAVFVASGPGGFSALRVGMSTAKALSASRSIPLVTVGTLDLEILPFTGLGSPVCAIIGAGRNRLYVGRRDVYDTATHTELSSVDQLMAVLSPHTLYCGEAVSEYAAEIVRRLDSNAMLADCPPPTRPACRLAQLGFDKLREGNTADAATVEPLYLRSSQVSSAERRWRTRQKTESTIET